MHFANFIRVYPILTGGYATAAVEAAHPVDRRGRRGEYNGGTAAATAASREDYGDGDDCAVNSAHLFFRQDGGESYFGLGGRMSWLVLSRSAGYCAIPRRPTTCTAVPPPWRSRTLC